MKVLNGTVAHRVQLRGASTPSISLAEQGSQEGTDVHRSMWPLRYYSCCCLRKIVGASLEIIIHQQSIHRRASEHDVVRRCVHQTPNMHLLQLQAHPDSEQGPEAFACTGGEVSCCRCASFFLRRTAKLLRSASSALFPGRRYAFSRWSSSSGVGTTFAYQANSRVCDSMDFDVKAPCAQGEYATALSYF